MKLFKLKKNIVFIKNYDFFSSKNHNKWKLALRHKLTSVGLMASCWSRPTVRTLYTVTKLPVSPLLFLPPPDRTTCHHHKANCQQYPLQRKDFISYFRSCHLPFCLLGTNRFVSSSGCLWQRLRKSDCVVQAAVSSLLAEATGNVGC